MSALGGGGETAAQHRVSLFPPIFWMHATLNLQFLTRSSLQATESYGAQRGKESEGIASPRTAWFPIADPGRWGEPDNNSPTKMTQATHRSRDYAIQADQAESHGQTRVSDSTHIHQDLIARGSRMRDRLVTSRRSGRGSGLAGPITPGATAVVRPHKDQARRVRFRSSRRYRPLVAPPV